VEGVAMTKTLTEQYKNKELSGWYYVKAKDGSINHWLLFTDSVEFETDEDIEEILAPVPSYDEYKRLQEQLKEANEAIKLYAETFVGNKNEDGTFTIYVFGSFPTNKNVYGYQELRYDPRPAKKYLKKWCVK
jgi:hypothetical protein